MRQKWTLAEALELYRQMVPCFKDQGYLLLLYGSVFVDAIVGKRLTYARLISKVPA